MSKSWRMSIPQSFSTSSVGIQPFSAYITTSNHWDETSDQQADPRRRRLLTSTPLALPSLLDLFGLDAAHHLAAARQHLPVDEERQFVGCLYSINFITLSVVNTPQLEELIPWLAMLPSLTEIDVSFWNLHSTAGENVAMASAGEVLRVALPWVRRILVSPIFGG
jgi:hypothetical protein